MGVDAAFVPLELTAA